MTIKNRYELRTGKFGYYFYDLIIDIDLSLELVLNKLNFTDKKILDLQDSINKQNIEINDLKNKLTIFDLGVR